MNRDDIKEFLELFSGYSKSSRMLAEAEEDEEGEEEKEDSKDEEKEEEVKVDKSDEVEFGKSLDDALNAMFVDIETDSLKSAKIEKKNESISLKKALLESDEKIDLETFAAETARIIKNADVLLDIESIILSKARDYLLSKYGEEEEAEFLQIMNSRFSIDARDEEDKEKLEDIEAPIAVGAGGGDAGG